MARQRFGVFEELESVADEWIRQSFEGVTKYSEKTSILTKWKQQMRERREVLTSSGFPEKHIRQGMYNRVANMANLQLNSRDGIARARSSGYNSASTQAQYTGRAPKGDEQDQN
jgi:hypothetical protein